MALILQDRVKVNTTTTGTGTVVLANTAPTGYQTFAVIGNANTTYYTIAGQTSAEWEVGIGTYYLANSSLSRDTILSSSAANAAVTFGVGTKDVFVTYPASQSVNEDAANIVNITSLVSSNVLISGGQVNSVAHTGGSINNMTIGATTANTGSFTNLTATTINSTSTTLLATSSGNVGVGTTTVPQKLNVTAVNSTGFAGQRITNNNANIGIAGVEFSSDSTYAKAAVGLVRNSPNGVGTLTFYNAASTGAADWATSDARLVITSAGNVGIGTTSPSANLQISNGGAKLRFGLDASSQYLDIYRDSPTGASTYNAAQASPFGLHVWQTASTERMRLDDSGNLGIGGTPTQKLDVMAASNTTVFARIYNANTNSSTVAALQLNAGGKYTNLSVNYTGNYFFNQGVGLTNIYQDYDYQSFRNTAGVTQLLISHTASANNYFQVTGGLGVGPTLSAIGADTNIDLKLTPKGTGYANITSGGIKFPDATVQTTAAGLVAGNSSIIINNINITANATIAANTNGFSVGPINTANGVSVTIASGSRWVVI